MTEIFPISWGGYDKGFYGTQNQNLTSDPYNLISDAYRASTVRSDKSITMISKYAEQKWMPEADVFIDKGHPLVPKLDLNKLQNQVEITLK